MTSLLRSLIAPPPPRALMGIDDVADMLRMGGYVLQTQQPSLAQPREEVGYDFEGYIYGILRANPIAFAAIMARARVFSQARFRFRELEDGEPGKLVGGKGLSLLEKPEPTMVLSDLLKRASMDADLAGNWFGVKRPERIKRIRPDWTWIILGSRYADETLDPRAVDAEVLGIVHRVGGVYSESRVESFLVGEYAHFAPNPDPIVSYRGMSWLTPIIRDLEGDQAMSLHKLMFMKNGATPSVIVKFPPTMDKTAAQEFIELFEQDHRGVLNAYKTVYLGGGADLDVIGSNLQQVDFKAVQGATETRIAVASGVPAVLLGVSEGLQGSSLNAGNYQAAKRNFADTTVRDMWQTMASSLESIVPPPDGHELWYDERRIPFLADDTTDAASVQSMQAGTIRTLVDGGFEPAVVIEAVTSGDLRRLQPAHTGLLPVQLQPPGTEAPAPEADGDPPPEDEEPDEEPMAMLARQLLAALPAGEEVRCNDCGRLLAEMAAPPYRFTCFKCKTVTSAVVPKALGWLLMAYEGQPRDARGRFSGSGRGGSRAPTVSAEEAYDAIAAGGQANVEPSEVKRFMAIARDGESATVDLTELQVEGTLKFGGDGLGFARDDMPQFADLDGTSHLDDYVKHAEQELGVSVRRGVPVAPEELHPVQKEVSAKKVGGMLDAMRDGSLPGGDIVVSSDDFVIDGHHRWGAGTALSFEKTGVRITATVIDMPAKDLLKDALEWTEKEGISRRGLAALLYRLELLASAFWAYEGQPRDARGRFGSGGKSGVGIGVSRERPELGGDEIHDYADIEAARKNPTIAAAESTTTRDLEQLGVDVSSQRQVAGYFEGGGEPSLRVELERGTSVEDVEVAGAYLVRRNEQDSVIIDVTGTEMERLGLEPNGQKLRITGLPTDPESRGQLFEEFQKTTPFGSWDEKSGTVEVSFFDADLTPATKRSFVELAQRHGASFTSQATHTRWYFQDAKTRSGATDYLHPRDRSVLRTPDEVRRTYPGARTGAIPDRRGSGQALLGGSGTWASAPGGPGSGGQAVDQHPGSVAPRLELLAYPGQPRDANGRFGSGGGSGKSSTSWMPPAQAAAIKAAEAGIVGQSFETAVVIGPDGSTILRKDGARTEVLFSDAEVDSMKGAVLTHNHPSGGELSGADISLAAEADLAAVRAVGTRVSSLEEVDPAARRQGGYGQEISAGGDPSFSELRKPEGGWPSRLAMEAAWQEGEGQAYAHFNREISMAKRGGLGKPEDVDRIVMYARQAHAGVAMKGAVEYLSKLHAGGAEDRVPVYDAGKL